MAVGCLDTKMWDRGLGAIAPITYHNCSLISDFTTGIEVEAQSMVPTTFWRNCILSWFYSIFPSILNPKPFKASIHISLSLGNNLENRKCIQKLENKDHKINLTILLNFTTFLNFPNFNGFQETKGFVLPMLNKLFTLM